jgi:uncharacterized protein YjbI with pentapeptide repeats
MKLSAGFAATFVCLSLGLISAGAAKEPYNGEGKDIRGQDLTKWREEFRGANFKDAIASEIKCDRLDMTGATFEDANVKYARFQGTTLSKVNFKGALFESMNFKYAKMDGAKLEEQTDFDCSQVETLRGANLQGAQIEGQPENTDFREADLRDADLSQVTYFPNARWKGAIYNSRTIWMRGFDPERAGCVKKDGGDDDAPPAKKK